MLIRISKKRFLRAACIAVAALVLSVSGCAKNAGDASVAVTGESAKAGAFLAYEHSLSISVDADQLAPRMQAAREACFEDRFGDCSLLNFEQDAGESPSGTLVVRMAPAGVEKMVALASQGGVIGSRNTKAEDLAETIADNERNRAELEGQRAYLAEFQSRKDLEVSDMLSIARELAVLKVQLTDVEKSDAMVRHRLESNLLTIRFNSQRNGGKLTRIVGSFSDSVDTLIDGISEVIDFVAFCLPFVIVLFPAALLWRWMWRKFTRSDRSHSP